MVVTEQPGGFSAGELERIRRVAGVVATAPVFSAQVVVVSPDGALREVVARAADRAAVAEVSHDADAGVFPEPGVAVVAEGFAHDGAELRIRGSHADAVVKVRVDDAAAPESLLLSREDFDALGVSMSWAGLMALEHSADKLPLSLHVPWLQLAAIVVDGVAAGMVAAVLPALAASRRPPVRDLVRAA